MGVEPLVPSHSSCFPFVTAMKSRACAAMSSMPRP